MLYLLFYHSDNLLFAVFIFHFVFFFLSFFFLLIIFLSNFSVEVALRVSDLNGREIIFMAVLLSISVFKSNFSFPFILMIRVRGRL